MSVERTLAIIKPDAVAAGAAGKILARIEQAGFKVLALKMIRSEWAEDGDFVEVQGSGEEATFAQPQLDEMLALGRKGIGELIAAQRAILPRTAPVDPN